MRFKKGGGYLGGGAPRVGGGGGVNYGEGKDSEKGKKLLRVGTSRVGL